MWRLDSDIARDLGSRRHWRRRKLKRAVSRLFCRIREKFRRLTRPVPTPVLFDACWYQDQNPEVRTSGEDPYLHYLRKGMAEGRRPNEEFYPLWYLKTYPEVCASGIDPLLDYENGGWRKGRDPSRYFDSVSYLKNHPDCAVAGRSPLQHYLASGGEKSDRPLPVKRFLLVSTHCPTRAHAGGLRILDIYSILRAAEPHALIDLYTQKKKDIDWNYDHIDTLFDDVIDSENQIFDYNTFIRLRPSPRSYDVIDFQYLVRPEDVDAFSRLARKTLFTPMECLSCDFALHRDVMDDETRERSALHAADEQAICRIVDEVVCVSQPDAEFLRSEFGFRNVSSMETGVSNIEFADVETRFAGVEPETQAVLFIAYFGSPTNVEALDWYLCDVHPKVKAAAPDYRLDVVGRGDLSRFAAMADPNIRIIGEVPEIVSEIARATVGIAPAVSGAGFRGKINQYAMMGVPAVVSPIAALGFAYVPGRDVLVGEDADAFAKHIVDLLKNADYRRSMGAAARAKCLELYSWASRVPEIKRLYAPKEGPVVHAIIPSYRHAPFLKARVESILNQTYRNIDLTVIDDCSPDDSDTILRDLQLRRRFTYFRRERNSGTPFSAWDFAARNFKDGLVWICESDDFAEPTFVERGLAAFRDNGALALFYCNSWVVDENDNRTGSTASYFSDVWRDGRWTQAFVADGREELANYQYRGMTVPNMSSALMKADAFRKAFQSRIKRYKLTGDWLFVGELLRYGDVAFTPDHLSNFRSHVATARAGVRVSRSEAEFILTKFRLHMLSGKKVKFLAQTLHSDCVRFLHEEPSAFKVLRDMVRVSLLDTLRLIPLFGYALCRNRRVFRELRTRRRDIRLKRI